MEEERISKTTIGYKEDKVIDLETLLTTPNKLNITTISICEDILVRKEDEVIKIVNSDKEHPFIIEKELFEDSFILQINEEYFLENQEQIIDIIEKICKTSTEEKITIKPKVFITESILKELANNDNIKTISLTPYTKIEEEQYRLTKKIYEIFKQSKVQKEVITKSISEDLENNFDSIIGYNTKKQLIGINTYKDLQDIDTILYIHNDLNEEEIENLKYIHPSKEITIDINNYDNVEKILDKIIELKINPQMQIKIKDKEIFNKTNIFKGNKYNDLNITISNGITMVPLNEYKRYEKILYQFIKPALDKDYSPFERYIYAYNISKRFKEYKEINTDNMEESLKARNLYEILLNEYMVCVGYSNMFSDLLNKLGIPNERISLSVTTNKKDEDVEFDGHARVYAHLQDKKYNIDGYYTSDPTWDNDLNNDYYNYLALTTKEVNQDHKKIRQGIRNNSQIADEIFNSLTIDELYNKINYIINYELNDYIKKCKNKQAVLKIKENTLHILYYIILAIICKLEVIDKNKYEEIINTYKIPNSYSDAKRDENVYNEFNKIISDIGPYIISKTNNNIDGTTIIDAAMVINKDVFNLNNEQEEEFRKHLIEINKERQIRAFPKRKIENIKTGKITYENEENKFDIEEIEQTSEKIK